MFCNSNASLGPASQPEIAGPQALCSTNSTLAHLLLVEPKFSIWVLNCKQVTPANLDRKGLY